MIENQKFISAVQRILNVSQTSSTMSFFERTEIKEGILNMLSSLTNKEDKDATTFLAAAVIAKSDGNMRELMNVKALIDEYLINQRPTVCNKNKIDSNKIDEAWAKFLSFDKSQIGLRDADTPLFKQAFEAGWRYFSERESDRVSVGDGWVRFSNRNNIYTSMAHDCFNTGMTYRCFNAGWVNSKADQSINNFYKNKLNFYQLKV